LCDHDPHEDPTNDLSDLAKQHFDTVTDYYASSSSSSSSPSPSSPTSSSLSSSSS
jgi:hypothetical protein